MAEQGPPERNHLGLVLPPELPAGPVPKELIKEHVKHSRKQLPQADGQHHLYWPKWYLQDQGGIVWRFRQHPLNIIDLTKDEHRWSHVLQDWRLDRNPSFMVAEIDPRTIDDFMDETHTYDELKVAVGAVIKTNQKMQKPHGRRPSLAALHECQAAQMERVDELIVATAEPEVIPPVLMQLGVARLLGQITQPEVV